MSLAGTNLSGIEAVNNFLGRSQFAADPGFIGSIDQFAIYDRALSPSGVLGNSNAGPIAGPTAAGTTAGALTFAEAVRPEFRLTSFVGVNFSNLNMKEGGGLFVDVVEGADTVVDGNLFPNVAIVLSESLLYVGPHNTSTSKNSKFQLTGGLAPFGAGVVVNQPFDGVVIG